MKFASFILINCANKLYNIVMKYFRLYAATYFGSLELINSKPETVKCHSAKCSNRYLRDRLSVCLSVYDPTIMHAVFTK